MVQWLDSGFTSVKYRVIIHTDDDAYQNKFISIIHIHDSQSLEDMETNDSSRLVMLCYVIILEHSSRIGISISCVLTTFMALNKKSTHYIAYPNFSYTQNVKMAFHHEYHKIPQIHEHKFYDEGESSQGGVWHTVQITQQSIPLAHAPRHLHEFPYHEWHLPWISTLQVPPNLMGIAVAILTAPICPQNSHGTIENQPNCKENIFKFPASPMPTHYLTQFAASTKFDPIYIHATSSSSINSASAWSRLRWMWMMFDQRNIIRNN